jgi:hypothetical protein
MPRIASPPARRHDLSAAPGHRQAASRRGLALNQDRAIITGLHADRREAKPLKAPITETFKLQRSHWILTFVVIELTCQISLLFPTFAVLRVFVRSAAYLTAILYLFVIPRGSKNHPSSAWAMLAWFIVAVSIVHPDTNSVGGGLATLGIYITVLSPIFWVPRIRIDVSTLRLLFMIYWLFNSLSALMGAVQIYYPGRFDPVVSTAWTENVVQALHITLADGTRVFRPMGLTDSPGGASIGAAISIIFAVAFLLDKPSPLFAVVLLASVGVSCFTMYLCQVRSMLAMVVASLLALSLPFVTQRRVGRYLWIVIPIAGIAVAAYVKAASVGGQALTTRWTTLVNDDVETVYYTNRGFFLANTLTELLPKYPFGAGLGRWGMAYAYFGDPYKVGAGPIWAEIQWTGLLFDGGVLLMFAFAASLVTALATAIRLGSRVDDRHGRELYKWATVLVGYAVGFTALTFNCCPFSSTGGVDFWLLNAAVFAASEQLKSS